MSDSRQRAPFAASRPRGWPQYARASPMQITGITQSPLGSDLCVGTADAAVRTRASLTLHTHVQQSYRTNPKLINASVNQRVSDGVRIETLRAQTIKIIFKTHTLGLLGMRAKNYELNIKLRKTSA